MPRRGEKKQLLDPVSCETQLGALANHNFTENLVLQGARKLNYNSEQLEVRQNISVQKYIRLEILCSGL